MKHERSTAPYQVIADTGGNRYRFFCELSGAVLCVTGPVRADTPEEELQLAWNEEGRAHFNRCHKCGKWVSNVMYNADELQCVQCAPWQEPRRFCTECGAALKEGEDCCPHCGRPVLKERCDY